tara:strand:- start:1803 stop:4934 length:3132 start_codon:yes stop_codon:yes gene_type:complete
MKQNALFLALLSICSIISFYGCKKQEPLLKIKRNDHIVLIGNNLSSRMMHYGFFETELHMRYPDSALYIRNMGDGGNTPGFRPHSGRNTPWAFPGAEQFQLEYGKATRSVGEFGYPDQWLTKLEADIIIGFFGFSESFGGADKVDVFAQELQAFIDHTLKQKYNGKTQPRLILVSPTAYEDLTTLLDVPDGVSENKNLRLYSDTIKVIAERNSIPFIDAFNASSSWYHSGGPYTIDGLQLNEKGYGMFAKFLTNALFGEEPTEDVNRTLINRAVNEKNWFWHNDFKIPNGIHVYGRRFEPFGPDNYPFEVKKIREMTAIRDTAIWLAARGIEMDLKTADKHTSQLPDVKTNYREEDYGIGGKYLYDYEAINKFHLAPGYKIEVFASEKEFKDLANPAQLSFDDKGRLWVAVIESYPHYKAGSSKPNDKLIILEDTDNDGRADKQITWAEGLHLPMGFELATEGVYVSQGTNLKLLVDTDNDDKADKVETLLSGFDDHDTHHAISAFCADPSGAIYMGEGVFLHSNVETPYGTVRATHGGFYRYNPTRHHLERTAQIPIPNPWGIAFDDYGQHFFLESAGPALRWMMPSTIKPLYGVGSPNSPDLIPEAHKVRPTSGLEFVSSRHFPEEVQGDILLCNVIGYLGIKQHAIIDDGTGYKAEYRQNLVWSEDKNFRPVDLEFAPDGSLYLVDWHNILVGHMQHNARDPYRDHEHGRVYRITYPQRPLVKPTQIHGATINELLQALKLPEYRTRYRARRALRGMDPTQVLSELKVWVSALDKNDPRHDHHLLEALWVSWGINHLDKNLLMRAFESPDFRVRTAAVRAIRYNGHVINNQVELLQQAAKDDHGRVRLEAIVAASWLEKEEGQTVINIATEKPIDNWMLDTYLATQHRLTGDPIIEEEIEEFPDHITEKMQLQYKLGRTIYMRDGFCGTCHQSDGKGLPAAGFPPLAQSEWVLENEERLIKLTLKGIQGMITVAGKEYAGDVPMTPFEGMLDDKEVAAVLTFVRNSFGNQASAIEEAQVKTIRAKIEDKRGFYLARELNQ